jgi:hypothetical protein
MRKINDPAASRVMRLSVFGPPPLLDSEDAAAYDELHAEVSAAVKPTNIIDNILYQVSLIKTHRPIAAVRWT